MESGPAGFANPNSHMRGWLFVVALMCAISGRAGVVPLPGNLVVDGVPELAPAAQLESARYLEFRTASFLDWHPRRREALILTRFADSLQIHAVAHPGGARRQLTFQTEPVAGGTFRPGNGAFVVFSQDRGGGEFFQLHRLDPDGGVTLLTDGKSRNLGPRWSRDGRWLAYTSTRRNGRDTDLWVMDPAAPATDRMVAAVTGGGWLIYDWSPDGAWLLAAENVSINESRLYRVEVGSGRLERVLAATHLEEGARGAPSVPHAIGKAQFAADPRFVLLTSDEHSEFRELYRAELATGEARSLTRRTPWDVEDFDPSPDGRRVAVVVNEAGASVLRVLDARSGRLVQQARLPLGVISGPRWQADGRTVGFTFSAARSPGDVYSLDVKSGRVDRWTESETGGLDVRRFAEPELRQGPGFDARTVSAFLYRPDPARFPGRRPVLVSLHGGPESQSRPGFQARNNYFLNELGVALLVPNIRGSSGYGKTFLTLDNGRLREDALKDVGTMLDWIQADAALDPGRVLVMGGSYGGYLVLASLVHHGDRLRGGVEAVGISNFVTFLENTQDYRRDLRRVEYGDERDPAMRAFLEQISPANHADRIRRPLFVIQGANDPRVPASESEQMVRAIRSHGGDVWYLVARDEGHGFRKKPNQDYQFLATIQFVHTHLIR